MSALSWALVACLALVAAQDLPTVHIVPHSHCDPGWLETYEVGLGRRPRSVGVRAR